MTNWDGFDSEQIQKVFGQRMRLRHPKPVSEILPSNLDDPLAFSRWRFYVPEDVPYPTDFCRSAFDFSVENLGIFLQWLLPGNVTYEGGAIKFIEGFYSPVSDMSSMLREIVRGLAAKGNRKIVLNLGEVQYIDSSGVGELVRTHTTVRNQDGQLRLVNLNKRVNDLLQITKLSAVFDIEKDEASAIRSLGGSAPSQAVA